MRKNQSPQIIVDAFMPVNQDAICINIKRYRLGDDSEWVQEYAVMNDVGEFEWKQYSGYDVIEPTFLIDGLMEMRGDVVDDDLLERLRQMAMQTRYWRKSFYPVHP